MCYNFFFLEIGIPWEGTKHLFVGPNALIPAEATANARSVLFQRRSKAVNVVLLVTWDLLLGREPLDDLGGTVNVLLRAEKVDDAFAMFPCVIKAPGASLSPKIVNASQRV